MIHIFTLIWPKFLYLGIYHRDSEQWEIQIEKIDSGFNDKHDGYAVIFQSLKW